MAVTNKQVNEQLIRLTEKVTTVSEQVEKLTHVLLEGNGQPALTTQVATLNQRVGALESGRHSSRKTSATIWAAIITGAFTFAEMLWRHLH